MNNPFFLILMNPIRAIVFVTRRIYARLASTLMIEERFQPIGLDLDPVDLGATKPLAGG